MPKINVYVPDDLKADMDRAGLKWSELAQVVFRLALDGMHSSVPHAHSLRIGESAARITFEREVAAKNTKPMSAEDLLWLFREGIRGYDKQHKGRLDAQWLGKPKRKAKLRS